MGFFNDATTEINGKIATLKTVSEKSASKLNKTSAGVNSLMDSIMNIFNQLGGYQDMIKTIENILSTKLTDIEEVIKSSIKTSLKQIISCSVEPSIGDLLILTGVTFDIKKIDPMSILAIDPISENGSYAYFDNLRGLNSKDFNVFLYSLIKESIANPSYTGSTWNKIELDTSNTPLFNATFIEYDQYSQKSNLLTIKIDNTLRGKKLSFFISEYLDSVKLFDNVQIISSIFDDLLSSNIFSINKTSEQMAVEATIKKIVDNILNTVNDGSDVIDDSFYTFSNDTYNQMLIDTQNKKDGLFTYNPSTNTNISIDQDVLLNSLNGLKVNNLLISQQTKVLTDTVDAVTQNLVDNGKIKDTNSFSFKFDFITSIITKLMTTITTFIFTPKIIFLFSMTTQIFGLKDPDNMIDFIKKNINVYKLIIVKIRDIIIQEIINKIEEMLAPLIAQVAIELVKEKFAIYKQLIDNIMGLITGAVSPVTSLTGLIQSTSETATDKAEKITSKTT